MLRHVTQPNILPYVDAIVSPNAVYAVHRCPETRNSCILTHCRYIFTELASGGDLMSFVNRYGTVSELDTRIILRQVIRGLAYLHRKGIVHRDIKPENILLAYSPKIAYHRIMLSDFGASAVPQRSRMITGAGTKDFQAP